MAAVFFDVDGTLVRWSESYDEILTAAFERTAGVAEVDWLDRYDERFFRHFEAFVEDPYRRAFEDVCDEFDVDAEPASLAETLVQCELDAVDPVPGADALVSTLGDRHTLGILTNGVPEVQFGKVERQGFLDRFDVTVASHEPGLRAIKPDGEIYEAAKDRVDADEYVMVGDDYEADVEAARRHGFETVHVDPSAEGLSVPDFETLAGLL